MLYHYVVSLCFITMFYHYVVSLCCITMLYHYVVSLCCITMLYHYVVSLCCITMLYHYVVSLCCITMLYHYVVSLCCITMLYHYVRRSGSLCCIMLIPCSYLVFILKHLGIDVKRGITCKNWYQSLYLYTPSNWSLYLAICFIICQAFVNYYHSLFLLYLHRL